MEPGVCEVTTSPFVDLRFQHADSVPCDDPEGHLSATLTLLCVAAIPTNKRIMEQVQHQRCNVFKLKNWIIKCRNCATISSRTSFKSHSNRKVEAQRLLSLSVSFGVNRPLRCSLMRYSLTV